MTPEETRLRDEFVQIIRPWFEVAMNSAIPEPWDVSEHCAARAADAILIRLRGEAGQHRTRAERLAGALEPLVRRMSAFDADRWDDETKVTVQFPTTKRARPTSFFYVADVKRARQALAQEDGQ